MTHYRNFSKLTSEEQMAILDKESFHGKKLSVDNIDYQLHEVDATVEEYSGPTGTMDGKIITIFRKRYQIKFLPDPIY